MESVTAQLRVQVSPASRLMGAEHGAPKGTDYPGREAIVGRRLAQSSGLRVVRRSSEWAPNESLGAGGAGLTLTHSGRASPGLSVRSACALRAVSVRFEIEAKFRTRSPGPPQRAVSVRLVSRLLP